MGHGSTRDQEGPRGLGTTTLSLVSVALGRYRAR